MRQFLVFDASGGRQRRIDGAPAGGLSFGSFVGVPDLDDHRHRDILVSGRTYSEDYLIQWCSEILTTCCGRNPISSVGEVMEWLNEDHHNWIIAEFLTHPDMV